FGIRSDSSVSGKGTMDAPSRCSAAMSSESVNPTQASPCATSFALTELPSTRNGLFAANARHHFCHRSSLQHCRNGPNTTLKPDWDRLLSDLDAGTTELKQIFLR